MAGPRARRMALSVASVALMGCGSTATFATPTTSPAFIQQYANAGTALDTATTLWDTLGQSLVAAGTNTVLGIQFPASAHNDVHTLVAAAGAVRTDLAGVASGAVTTSQFVSDESNLQAAINIVQRDIGLGSSTPIAGA